MPSSDRSTPPTTHITFDSFDSDDSRRRGSLLGLGNGLLFVRGGPCDAADGDGDYPGTYRAGCYNRREVEFDGVAMGHDALVNLPDWRRLTFRIGDAPWHSPGRMRVLSYRHTLDLGRGVTERRVQTEDDAGRRTTVCERRLVSMVHPTLAAIRLEITPENWAGAVEIRSAIDGTVANANTDHETLPAYRHLEPRDGQDIGDGVIRLEAVTRQSRIHVAVAVRTVVPEAGSRRVETAPGWVAEHVTATLRQGETLAIEKLASITTARDPATSEAGEASLTVLAGAVDFATLEAEQVRIWARLWGRIGLRTENPELQRAIDIHAFHVLQTISPHSVQVDVGLPSRGWQEAYHGQIFWDEAFTFPFINHRFPEIARGLLMHRYRRLPAARHAAAAAGFRGAMFPWRSASSGNEETPNWQFNPLSKHWMRDATRLQRHIGTTVATNVWHYHQATGDDSFLAEYGAELMVDVSRFWCSIAEHDAADDRFDIRGVIGPDEYHDGYPGADRKGIDNNAYTNVMAAVTLRRTRIVLDRLPAPRRAELVDAMGIDAAELARWERVSRRLRLCFHEDGVLSQFEGFERLKAFDSAAFAAEQPDGRVDWTLEAKGDTVTAYQVTKQADLLMLLYLLQPEDLAEFIRSMGYAMDIATLRRTVDYYLDRITHESSLSRVVCAGVMARFDPERSWTFFQEAMSIDVDKSKSSSAAEGLHLGAMAGMLDVLQRHYLGLHVRDDALMLAPSPPAALGPVRMRLAHRNGFLTVDWTGTMLHVTADATNPSALAVLRDGERALLAPGETTTFAPVAVAR